MALLKPSAAVAVRALLSTFATGYRRLTNKLATSEVLALTNLLMVGAIYGQISGRIVSAIQFVIIPVTLLATVASAVRDFLHPRTRSHSAVAIALSVPVGFIYFVWHGWVSP